MGKKVFLSGKFRRHADISYIIFLMYEIFERRHIILKLRNLEIGYHLSLSLITDIFFLKWTIRNLKNYIICITPPRRGPRIKGRARFLGTRPVLQTNR